MEAPPPSMSAASALLLARTYVCVSFIVALSFPHLPVPPSPPRPPPPRLPRREQLDFTEPPKEREGKSAQDSSWGNSLADDCKVAGPAARRRRRCCCRRRRQRASASAAAPAVLFHLFLFCFFFFCKKFDLTLSHISRNSPPPTQTPPAGTTCNHATRANLL